MVFQSWNIWTLAGIMCWSSLILEFSRTHPSWSVCGTIDLALNSLSSLEPWPLIRGQVVSGCSVNFDRNKIETFTNSLKFRYRCGMQPIRMSLNLRKNEVKHFTDIIDGWGFSRKVDFLCLFGNSDQSFFELILKSTGMICDCTDYAVFSFLKKNATQWSTERRLLCGTVESLRPEIHGTSAGWLRMRCIWAMSHKLCLL